MCLVEYHRDSAQIIKPSVTAEDRGAIPGMVDKYRDVSQGIGKLKGFKVKLHVDPGDNGVVQKQRRISIPLKDKFNELSPLPSTVNSRH